MRLDLFLTDNYKGLHTRSQIANAIKAGQVTVNGVTVTKAGAEVSETDNIEANFTPRETTAQPEKIPIDVVFEDEYLMIVNKPRGMVVHPGAARSSGTLLNGLLSMQDAGLKRAGIVHRLDMNTAGLLVVAKTEQSQALLAAMFEKHTVERTYWGIVEGEMSGSGTIDKNIIRDPNHRTLFKVTQNGGRRAVTHFKVLQNLKRYTLVEFKLETGRTHQIRVHCKSIGYPIVGDPEYNPNSKIKTSGQMLESVALSFTHPITKKFVEVKAEPSSEFQSILKKLVLFC